MSELRQNIVTKQWVIIATERANRPNEFAESKNRVLTHQRPVRDPGCPFCPGNEELDLETGRILNEAGDDWLVRSVRNLYPALDKEETLSRTFDGVHRWISGVGHHEVIVDNRRHNTTLALMSPAEIALALELFYNRGWALQGDPRVEQLVYFKNHRERAGASLEHPHSQIIGLPVVPNSIRQRNEEARRYFDDTGQCVYCVMSNDERNRGERIIAETEHFVAFVLYAAPVPFNIWILPKQHRVSYLFTNQVERADLAHILRDVLTRLYVGLCDPALNVVIRSAPAKELNSDFLHWHLAIVPRLSQLAGFELGSGMYINPTVPEACAAFLRDVDVSELEEWQMPEIEENSQ